MLNTVTSATQPLEADSVLFSVENNATASAAKAQLQKSKTSSGQQPTSGQEPGQSNPAPTKNVLLVQLAAPDSDGDVLSDAEERKLGTDPLNPDTDGDGYPDGLEVVLGSDPLDPNRVPDVRPPGILTGPLFDIEN